MKRRVEFEVPEAAIGARCRSCGAPIVWCVVGERANGSVKRMPLDLRTAQRGLDGVQRAESHFAHCPQADEHRRRRR